MALGLLHMLNAATGTEDAVRGAVRLQEMRQSLQDHNDSYYNKIYDRVDRYQSNLTDYQYHTNKRLDYLESRLKKIEASSTGFPVTINNQNGNSEASVVTSDK